MWPMSYNIIMKLYTSTKFVIGEVVFLALAVSLLVLFHFPRLVPLNVDLALHILGAVMFIGNIVVTAFWMLRAERTKDRSAIAFAAQAVNWADVFFTAPGVILLVLSGLQMALYCDECTQGFATRWLDVALGLFSISGVLWTFLLIYQNRLLRELEEGSKEFYKTLHRWYIVGAVNTIIPIIILAIMTVKPSF